MLIRSLVEFCSFALVLCVFVCVCMYVCMCVYLVYAEAWFLVVVGEVVMLEVVDVQPPW